jgi:hypothetical protein
MPYIVCRCTSARAVAHIFMRRIYANPERSHSLNAVVLAGALHDAGLKIKDAARMIDVSSDLLYESLADGLQNDRLNAKLEALVFGYKRALFCLPARLRSRAHCAKVLKCDPECLTRDELLPVARKLGYRFDGKTTRAQIIDLVLSRAATMREPAAPTPTTTMLEHAHV